MAKKDEILIEIKPIDIKYVPVKIVGDSPLIVHAWSDKAKMLYRRRKRIMTNGRL